MRHKKKKKKAELFGFFATLSILPDVFHCEWQARSFSFERRGREKKRGMVKSGNRI